MKLSNILREAIHMDSLVNVLDERKALPIGAKRTWKSGEKVKLAPRKWVSANEKNLKIAKKREKREGFKSTIQAFKKGIEDGEITVKKKKQLPDGSIQTKETKVPFGVPGMKFKDHVREAKQKLKENNERLGSLMDELRDMAPAGGIVQGRAKEMESILGKLLRKPKLYKRPSDLNDITGTRIIADTVDGAQSAVDKVKKRFKIIDEKDNLKNAREDGYRSNHLIIEDDDGNRKEVQIRTKNQNTFADWSHNVYKPRNPEEKRVVEQNVDDINKFSKDISEFFFAQDTGKNPPPPPRPKCPGAISGTLGCI